MRPIAMSGALMLFVVLSGASAQVEESLPVGANPLPIDTPHFPDRVHAFIWRNWQLVGAERMARVLGTSAENVIDVAVSMGLPPAPAIPPEMRQRGYFTILRRNWHLLPYKQLLELLEMTSEELAYALREDDFLFLKLGALKPKCEPLEYRAPDARARKRAVEIKQVVQRYFGKQLEQSAEPRFHFVEHQRAAGTTRCVLRSTSQNGRSARRRLYRDVHQRSAGPAVAHRFAGLRLPGSS